jgi:hypothetical protein
LDDEAAGAVVVVLTGATVVVVTLGGAFVGATTPRAGGDDSNDVVGLVVSGVEFTSVVVVVAGDGCVPLLGGPVEVAGAGASEECWASAGASATPCRCLARGLLPVVATSSAMSANDTARITHQLGRPRTTRARPTSVVPAPASATGTPYARVMQAAPGDQAHR